MATLWEALVWGCWDGGDKQGCSGQALRRAPLRGLRITQRELGKEEACFRRRCGLGRALKGGA